MELNNNKGVLLVNLGTPNAPTSAAVKQFLSQFLHDHRVVDMTRWLWCPLLHGIILPIRAPKVAKLYQSIWMDGGSPLLVHSKNQVKKLEARLQLPVELGMTYGSPSLLTGLENLQQRGVDEIILLPLYPQYSGTTTGAVQDACDKAVTKISGKYSVSLVNDYHDHPLYIKALANKVRQFWQQNGQGDYLLCSYHGIPQRYANNGDVYPQHCEKTTQLLAKELALDSDKIGMSYQSRFGKEEWLKPYTDMTLKALASSTKRVDIISPAFSVDCLETLEELAQECKELFLQAGGEDFRYIACLNDDDDHIEMMMELVTNNAS
ncbi:ferrochelatase [Vibrio sp. TH_r3]|uniref:ferrochelatase n=1 Tax=Vibrio sp. TH_r3 TaxID=3082084 RepID=UPI0029532E7B|nr:ferrochelatase [Vibrio sp. TH_r3]MDV7104070.1 ferrochelatase [Vibrio sp. TH_r3]